MESLFRDYWWLIFPIGAFLFGAWDRWLSYRRSRDHLDLIRTYADQGKEPPAALLRGVNGDEPFMTDPDAPDFPGLPGAAGWGLPSREMRRAYRRYYRQAYRWSPYWQWRKVVVLAAVAGGFWWASRYSEAPAGTHGGLRVVAVILTCVAAANLVFALLSMGRRPR